MRSKINHLNPSGTWDAPDGATLFVHEIGFVDGNSGNLYHKSPGLPFGLGDIVEYEVDNTKKTTKIKVTKWGDELDRISDRDKIQLAIIAQSSISTASNYCAAKGLTSSDAELFSLADDIFAWVRSKSSF